MVSYMKSTREEDSVCLSLKEAHPYFTCVRYLRDGVEILPGWGGMLADRFNRQYIVGIFYFIIDMIQDVNAMAFRFDFFR